MNNRLIERAKEMRKVWKLEDLDCAHCAGKIEQAVQALEGVESANVSFMAQKMTVDFSGDEDEMSELIAKTVAEVEPDVSLSE